MDMQPPLDCTLWPQVLQGVQSCCMAGTPPRAAPWLDSARAHPLADSRLAPCLKLKCVTSHVEQLHRCIAFQMHAIVCSAPGATLAK